MKKKFRRMGLSPQTKISGYVTVLISGYVTVFFRTNLYVYINYVCIQCTVAIRVAVLGQLSLASLQGR